MELLWEPGTALTPGQCYISPALLETEDPLLPEYIRWVTEHLGLSVANQPDISPREKSAYEELKKLEASV